MKLNCILRHRLVAAPRQRAANFFLRPRNGGALPRRRYDDGAFCRAEFAAVIAAVALIALVALPMLATTKYDSQRALCANNLRLVGRGLHSWIGDNGTGYLPWRTPISQGGTFPPSGSKVGAAWYEWAFLSNYLVTPKILACPADEGVMVAPSFGQFVQSAYRANAASYTISLDTYAEARRVGVSTDRNLPMAGPVGCSSGVINADGTTGSDPQAGWTNGAVHGEFGHALVTDGSVEFTSRAGIREHFRGEFDDNGSIHFLRPR